VVLLRRNGYYCQETEFSPCDGMQSAVAESQTLFLSGDVYTSRHCHVYMYINLNQLSRLALRVGMTASASK